MQAQSAYTWLRWAHAAMVRDALLRNETPLTTRIVITPPPRPALDRS
jgi:hypothetical protein